MLRYARRIVVSAIFAVMLPGAAALACGFHGVVYGGLTIPYPGSLHVAVSIAKARQLGVIPSRDLLPQSPFAFHAAVARLEELRTRLDAYASAHADSDLQQFSVLFVGSRLWSHYRLDGTRLEAKHHVAGPITGSPVLLTDYAVLSALLADELDVRDALEMGLVAISGDATGRVTELIVSGLSRPARRG